MDDSGRSEHQESSDVDDGGMAPAEISDQEDLDHPDSEDSEGRQDDYRDAALRFLLGTAWCDDPPTEETVPRAALQPLVDLLADKLSHHERGCRHAPAVLRPLAHMQARLLRRDPMAATIWKALWTERDHDFIADVIAVWLEGQKSLAQDCRADTLDEGVLYEALSEDEHRRLPVLATTLWCLGLDDSTRDRLFRLVVSLVLFMDRTPDREVLPKPADAPAPPSKRIRDELRDLRARATKADQQEKALRSRIRQLERDAQAALTTADEARRLMEEATQARNLERAEREEVEKSLRITAEDVDRLGKQSDKARRRIKDLQDLVADLQLQLSTATKRESTMTSELASVRRDVEQLQQRLASLPRPEEAVHQFICTQEKEINLDRAIKQGGERKAAEERHAKLMKLERAFLDFCPEFRAPRPPPLIRQGPLRYWGLGGADEVGASAYLIEIAGRRILVDCGIRVGRDLEELGPDLGSVERIDAMVLTHAHTDHVGWLPAAVRNYDHFEVYTSPETQDIIPVMLEDSLLQLTRLLSFRREKERYGGVPPEESFPDPYERTDKDNALLRLRPLEWRQDIGLRGDLRITLFPAGHILGAATVLIEGDGRRVVVSGDFAAFPQRTVVGAAWPEELYRPDLLILESTYGDTNHPSRDGQENRLIEEVSRVVRAGGVALIPCFALGRAQEVLTILSEAMESGAIERFPVWIDGMIQKVNAIYRMHGRLSLGEDFHEVMTEGWSRDEIITRSRQEPCAIVTTSGMLAGGPGVEYAQRLLTNGNNRLFFVGYLDEESPGRKLMRLGSARPQDRYVEIQDEYGEAVRIQAAAPARKVQLSAHSDQQALIESVQVLAPASTVLVHGENSAREGLAERLSEAGWLVDAAGKRFESEG